MTAPLTGLRVLHALQYLQLAIPSTALLIPMEPRLAKITASGINLSNGIVDYLLLIAI